MSSSGLFDTTILSYLKEVEQANLIGKRHKNILRKRIKSSLLAMEKSGKLVHNQPEIDVWIDQISDK